MARALHINNQSRDRRGTFLLRSRRTFCCVFSLDFGSLTRLLCAIIALESLDLHFKTRCSVSVSYLLQPERRTLKSSIPGATRKEIFELSLFQKRNKIDDSEIMGEGIKSYAKQRKKKQYELTPNGALRSFSPEAQQCMKSHQCCDRFSIRSKRAPSRLADGNFLVRVGDCGCGWKS